MIRGELFGKKFSPLTPFKNFWKRGIEQKILLAEQVIELLEVKRGRTLRTDLFLFIYEISVYYEDYKLFLIVLLKQIIWRTL